MRKTLFARKDARRDMSASVFHEELARLEASALGYYEQVETQNLHIQELQESLKRIEESTFPAERMSGLNQDLENANLANAEKDRHISELKSALVAKEQMRFDLELKLRALLSRGEVSIKVQSSASGTGGADGRAVTASDTAGAAEILAEAPATSLHGVRCLEYRSMLTRLRLGRRDTGEKGQTKALPYPRLGAPSKGYVFIVTYPRSGDLVLQRMLNTLPGYCIRGELGGPLKPLSGAWAETVISGWQTDKDDFELASLLFGWKLADAFVTNVLKLPDDVRVAGFRSNEIYQDIGEFWNMMSFLYTNFPNSRIVFNTRDAQKVSRSGPWTQRPQDEVLRTLETMDRFFEEFAQSYPERSICVRYSDYMTDPKRLSEFLGEELTPLPN